MYRNNATASDVDEPPSPVDNSDAATFEQQRADVLARIDRLSTELQTLMHHVGSFIDDAHETGAVEPEALAAATPIAWQAQAQFNLQTGLMMARRAVAMPTHF